LGSTYVLPTGYTLIQGVDGSNEYVFAYKIAVGSDASAVCFGLFCNFFVGCVKAGADYRGADNKRERV